MLRRGLLHCASTVKHILTAKRFKYVSTGVTILSFSYVVLPSDKKRRVKGVIGSSTRFARSFRIGAMISMDYLIAPVIGHTDTEIHQRSANRILQGCLKNGGIYIKLGQGLAAMNNILPEEYIKTLSALQDTCLTRGKDEIEEIFLQDFGKKPEEMLRKIELEPIAAASLAQVYKGTTLDGQEVAVKVQYIDLQDRFISDMNALIYLLKIVSFVHAKFNLHWVVDELFETLKKELDFENEGRNSEQCAEDLKKFEYAYIPKIYWDLSSKRVLTAEWIDGVKVTDIEGIKKQGLDITDVDKKLVTLMGEQIFHTGFVHGDPHPGNVLVRKGKKKKAQIVLLDHGLYEHLAEKTRCNLCNFWESIVLRDDRLLKIYANNLNVTDYVLLTEMLTQTPYRISFTSIPNNMTLDDYMAKQVQKRFDQITLALRSMPKTILLVIRNLNIIRSIIRNHGDIIDRYKIMARIAVRGKYQVSKRSFKKNIATVVSVIKFEFLLWFHMVTQWIFKAYLNILQFLGYDITKILQMV